MSASLYLFLFSRNGSRSRHSGLPSSHVIALWPPIRSLIEDLPLDTRLRLSRFEDMLSELPPLLEEYNAKQTEKALEALRRHEPGATKEDLYKASSLFRCSSPWCSNRTVTYGYPGILTHACVYTNRDKFGPEVLRLPGWQRSKGCGAFISDTAETVLNEEAKEMVVGVP
ncbi:hypothetical protein PQX77_020587 [Marasmius sp. AFHP31]|nr:hypothetical protein PQX77_020587 [Marasmius sp. AFHP31]